MAGAGIRAAQAQQLDVARLRSLLAGDVDAVAFRSTTSSTNDDAWNWRGPLKRPVLFACDAQTSGRGRHGRKWIDGGRDALAFTVLHPLDAQLTACASLAAGAGIAAGLASCGARAWLKWPNDLLDAQRRKFGGILIEARDAPPRIAVGVGINLRMTQRMHAQLDARSAAGLAEQAHDRTDLLAALAQSLVRALDGLARDGPAATVRKWRRRTAHRRGERMTVSDGAGRKETAAYVGVAGDGALLCTVGGRMRRMYSAQVYAHDPDA